MNHCYLTPTFPGTQKSVEILRHPCILEDPQRQSRGAKNQKWCQTKKNKMRNAFSGDQKRAEMLRRPYILEYTQRQRWGVKNE